MFTSKPSALRKVRRPPILFAEWFVVLNGCVPLVMLMYDARYRQLGADPIRNALQVTGAMSLFLLIATLSITPLQRISGFRDLVKSRRPLGLMSFLYASAHVLIYVGYDRVWDWADALSELSQRRYLQAGALAFLIMIPLAITSSPNMMRLLGSRQWKRLHKCVYVAAIAGAIHFWMQSKANFYLQVGSFIAVGILLMTRVANRWEPRRSTRIT
ncbi:MAG: protein-methionine-sulfoxide reductase heme-binding subunit MsrQ [Planctomycetota bacterium]